VVFDAAGVCRGLLTVPAGFARRDVALHRVVGVQRDADDVQCLEAVRRRENGLGPVPRTTVVSGVPVQGDER